MVITFSNIKGSAGGGGGGATGGTVSGITLWSDETTKAYIDDALSGVTDVLSAYTKTEDFATINGSAITSGGNLVIEATPYTAGTNIDIADHIISVTGITVPTSNTAFTNDAGYVTSGEVETQITGKNYATESWVQNNINLAIESETARTELTYAKIGDIPSLDGYATTGWVESQGYLTEHQDISGKLNTSDFTAYTANTQTELNNKQDISGMTAYATTAFTENTYAKIGDIPTKTSDLTNDSGFITDAALSGYATEQYVDNSVSGKVDNSALTQYYTSAQTDTAIQNATNGLASEEWVNNQGFLKEHQDISGKLDTSVFTAYTANTQTEIDNKQDASAMTAYATTAFTESTYLKEHQSLSAYSTTEQMNQAIGSATAATTGWVESQGFLTEHQSLSAYTPTSGFSTINGSAITSGDNLVIEETPYSGGTNIDITDHIISVTGITIPTKLSELTNDEGFVNSGEVETQITNKGYITGYTETDPVFMASAASGISAQDITNWNAKLDSSALTPYYTSTQTDNAISNAVSGKVDSSRVDEIEEVTASALVELHGTKQDILVSGTNIKTINNESILGSGNIVIQGGSGSDYSAGANIDITNNVISVTGITIPTSNTAFTNDAGYVNSGEVETQITSKGYITGYTETDPVFQASAASGISEQDITNWNNKLDSSALTPYYTSAQTNTAISNATSGKQDTLVSGTNIKTINNESLLGSGNIVIQGGSGGSSYTAGNNIDITNDVISVTGLATINGSAITEGGNIVIQGGSGGGSNIIELTQAEYDALTAYTEDAIYVITDSQAINMDNYVTTGALGSYYTSAETDTAISNAVSGKTDKVSVTASSGGYKFPTWNDQGCITGTSATAYQASQAINGSSRTLYSNSSSSLPTIYAPTSAGSAGQPLLSNGSGAPVWASYKFQFISQSQYDALATKDSTTIYFIVNEN